GGHGRGRCPGKVVRREGIPMREVVRVRLRRRRPGEGPAETRPPRPPREPRAAERTWPAIGASAPSPDVAWSKPRKSPAGSGPRGRPATTAVEAGCQSVRSGAPELISRSGTPPARDLRGQSASLRQAPI